MAKPNYDESQKLWAKVQAKAWADPNFKAKLLKNPVQALKEMGINIPSEQKVEIHENTRNVTHFIIGEKPKDELREEDLKQVSGGWCFCSWNK